MYRECDHAPHNTHEKDTKRIADLGLQDGTATKSDHDTTQQKQGVASMEISNETDKARQRKALDEHKPLVCCRGSRASMQATQQSQGDSCAERTAHSNTTRTRNW